MGRGKCQTGKSCLRPLTLDVAREKYKLTIFWYYDDTSYRLTFYMGNPPPFFWDMKEMKSSQLLIYLLHRYQQCLELGKAQRSRKVIRLSCVGHRDMTVKLSSAAHPQNTHKHTMCKKLESQASPWNQALWYEITHPTQCLNILATCPETSPF